VSGDAFRDALTDVVFAGRWCTSCGIGTADDILAMPEMQAIKAVLWHHYAQWDGSDPRPEDMVPDLSKSVIDWVLGGQP
jgi:hypothetical protein